MWNIHGVIPPIAPGERGESQNRSPYEISIVKFVDIFSTSPERINILLGLLNYRQYLYSIGIKEGLQWVNGSFTENVEILRDRPPADIDLVSIFDLSNKDDDWWARNESTLFNHAHIKQSFKVDGYWIDSSQPMCESIGEVTYWYSMWSHQRDTDIWKGFFTMPLSAEDDVIALQNIRGVSNHA